jgi:dUTP pyrophosphatase
MAKRTAKAQTLRVVVLPHGRDLPLPQYQTDGAAGLDLVAAIPAEKPLRLKRNTFALVPTGLVLEIPHGYEVQVRPRSGLAAKHGITVLNAPGTIDSDYRGEVQVILINHGAKTFVIQRGERIAQMIVASVTRAALTKVEVVQDTKRGPGGFGSTGSAAKPVTKAAAKPAAKAKAKPAKALAAAKSKTVPFPRRPIAQRAVRRR